jgi:CRP-like cAMP-binding protein
MQELGQSERAKLFERFGRAYEAGVTIYAEGEEADCCFLLEEGRVRLVKHIRSTERSVGVLGAGHLFGEDALLPHSRRSAAAVTLTDVSLLALDRQTFGVLVAGNAEVATQLVQQLVRRLRDAEEQVENSMLEDQPSRVVNTLLRLASVTEPSEQGYALRVSPLELSSRVGVDVDTVKRVVGRLREGGYVEIADERIVVPQLEPLRRLYHLLGMKEEVRGGLL